MLTRCYFSTIFLLVAFSCFIDAQSRSFKSEEEVKVTNVGPVFSGDQVTGYFMFAVIEKAKKRQNKYLLQLFDENLELMVEKEMLEKRELYLREAELYNNRYHLKFFEANPQEPRVKIFVFDKHGEITFQQYVRTTFAPESATSMPAKVFIQNRNRSIRTVEDKGVFSYTIYQVKGDKTRYGIHYFSGEGAEKDWAFRSEKTNKHESTEFLGVKGDTLLSMIYREKLFGPDFGVYGTITGIDINTGELLFSRNIGGDDEKMGFKPLRFKMQAAKDEIMLAGIYYEVKSFEFLLPKALGLDKPNGAPGFMFAHVNGDGTLKDIKYLPFEKLKPFIPLKKNKKPYSLCFHNIIRTNANETFLVYESFRSSANKIKDLVLIPLDKNFQPTTTKIFEKEEKKVKSNLTIPGRTSLGNWNQNYKYKEIGLDYTFSMRDQTRNSFIIGYLTGENMKEPRLIGKGEKRKGAPTWAFGAIFYVDGRYIIDQFKLHSEADEVIIMPAKFGHVCILEYFKKEKRIKTEIEVLKFD